MSQNASALKVTRTTIRTNVQAGTMSAAPTGLCTLFCSKLVC